MALGEFISSSRKRGVQVIQLDWVGRAEKDVGLLSL